MTTKTTDFTGLLYYNPIAQGFNPAVSATLINDATVDEGAALTFEVVAWNVADNTGLFYAVTSLVNLTSDRFDTVAGPVAIVNNRGTFTITVNADSTTASGAQTYNVVISKMLNGPALATVTITVNDTSQSAPTGVDFFYAGDQNSWIAFGGLQAGSTFSNPAPAFTSYTYPDGSYTGHTRDFDGTTWMASINMNIGNAWPTNAITVDYWFYPTAYGVQLLSESNNPDVTSGYHYSMLEIDSNGYVNARFYNGGYPSFAVVSHLPVALNRWNHIWFSEDEVGGHSFELNGIATNGNIVYTRVKPTPATYFVIGETDATSMITSGRFQGKIGYLTISDYQAASTFSGQRNKFKPAFVGFQSATNGGSNGVHIDSDPYNDTWLSTVPVGATIVANGVGTFTVTGVAAPNDPGNFSGNWFYSLTPTNGNFPAGTRMTISW